MPHELGHLEVEISQQRAEDATWFLLADYRKPGGDKLREGRLNQEKAELHGFENSQPLWTSNKVKIRQRLPHRD